MKKVAVTVAVLALGLAACQDNAADDANSVVNTVENEAAADTNAALDATGNAADNALDAASNSIDAAGNAVENAGDAVENATDNAM